MKIEVKIFRVQSQKSNLTSVPFALAFIPILKGIEVKMYPAKIGRARGWKKQHVAYYVKKLEKAGLIRRLKRSNFVDYELTEQGQNFLISCEGVLFSSGVFRLHRCFFKFPVLREGVYPAADFRRIEMVNWTALLGLEQGVKVRHTTTSWIVHVETLVWSESRGACDFG